MESVENDRITNEFLEMFPNLPSPEYEPKKFEYYVKLFKYLYNSNTNQAK